MKHDKKPSPVAVIGIGCLFPKAPGLKEYWRLLYRAEDAVTEVPETHWSHRDYYSENPKTQDHTYCTRGGYLSAVPFNPAEFGIPPSILEATDTSQILGLVTTRMALDDAGYGKTRDFDRSRVSVMLGATVTQELVISMGSRLGHPKWRKALEDSGIPADKAQEVVERISDSYPAWQESSFPGLLGNVIAGRIANRFDFGGTNTTLDAACASSFTALNLAFMELQTGRSDMVVTGGVDTLNDIFMHMCFAQTGVLSHEGKVKAFSDSADGTVLSEGIGILILKTLDQAEKDKDRIYAVIRSVGSSSDGKSLSIYAPSAKGQARAIRRAYDQAGIDPSTVEMIEAHGTGTRGDVVEFDGLVMAFSSENAKKNRCGIGTVKSNIGHAKATAGVAGLIKGILALYHKVMPPLINLDKLDPKINVKDSPFYFLTQPRPWMPPKNHPRRCGVTASGFGGSNFHVVLEEYGRDKPDTSWDGSVEILAFSGHSREDVLKKLTDFKSSVSMEGPLFECDAFFRYQASLTRQTFNPEEKARFLLIVTTDERPAELVDQALAELASSPADSFEKKGMYFSSKPAVSDNLAFVFPGQGSQYTHMGRDIVNLFADTRAVLEKADTAFGGDEPRLSDIMYPLPDHIVDTKTAEEALRKTDKAQPAIGAVSLAMDRTLRRFGLKPKAVCGHSFGELTAMCSAGWISEDTFLNLAVSRGRHMAACGDNAGTMLAVKASLDDLDATIRKSGIPVILANRNCYDQGVLSGSFEAIDKAEALCKEKGYRTTRLPVAAAFHSSLVEKAAQPFSREVDKQAIQPTAIPVYSNTTGEAYPAKDVKAIKKILGHQLLNPVNFVANVENLCKNGIKAFVEVGPKPVLTGLIKSMAGSGAVGRDVNVISLDASSGKKQGAIDLAKALCQLASIGCPVQLSAWEDPLAKPEKQGMSIPITGANHRNPVKPRPKTTFAVPVSAEPASFAIAEKRTPDVHPIENKTENKAVPMPMKPVEKHVVPENQTLAAPVQTAATQEALQVIAEGLKAMQTIQSQTAEAHSRFLAAQTEAGRTLQDIMEKARQMMTGQVVAAPGETRVQRTEAARPAVPSPAITQESRPAPVRPTVAETPVFKAPAAPAPVPKAPAKPVTVAAAAPVAKAVPAAATKKPSADFRKTIEKHMLDVVSELTGYPVDMIGLDMDIEADLGIDSIKRVEIMSAFEERMKDMPPISPEAMATIKTLGEIVAFVCGAAGETPAAAFPAPAPAPAIQSLDLEKISKAMLDVVSELTGYPVDMIGLDMDIEADLGIDSIKRVEIMSAFEERVPDLPSISPEAMATLKTLGEILSYVAAEGTSTALTAAPAPVAALPAVDLAKITGIMLEVVSELTGYPVDMIGLDMDIEADLGIDSIKRVEIMSAFEERTPDLPSVTPEAMAGIKTLGEIIAYVGESLASVPAAAAAAGPSAAPAGPAVDIQHLTSAMLAVVSELTGYPEDMIGLDMDIEADLGIDSIKRVEIMSAFEERVPGLPSLSPEDMAVLKTLGDIVAHVGRSFAAPSAAAATAAPQVLAKPLKTLDMDLVTRTMRSVVSRLTGYPEDLVALDMDIEADLGIDSIKRVEIMSEFETLVPDLPAFDPDVMVTLKTLQQILDYVDALQKGSAQAAPASAPAVSADQETDDLEGPVDTSVVNRQIVRLEKRPLVSQRVVAVPAKRKVYVTDDKNGLSAAIAGELKARKIPVAIIQLDDNPQDAAGLVIVPELKKKGALASLAGFKKKDSDLWDRNHEEFLKKAFDLAHRTGKSLMESADQGGAFFATISRLDGTFGFGGGKLQAPVLGGLSGLAKTADLEWEKVSCKAIDVDLSVKVNTQLARRVVDELLSRGAVEVGLTDQDRVVLHLEKAPVEQGNLDLSPRDVVIVSGGAKGVTAAAAIALARNASPTIILMGRTDEPGPEPAWLKPLKDEAAIKKGILENLFKGQKVTPAQVEKELKTILGNREITRTLALLKKAGSNAAYFPADVRDLASVSRVIEEVKAAFGPIKGLIHGAGVLEDRFIVDQTLDQFNKVYNTKVNGLENLLKAIPEDEMRYLVLFSSVSARVGNTGQVAYAMANEVLNKVGRAYAEQNKSCRVVSINWGPWDGGMVTESLKKEFAKKHVELIPIREGAECMVREMAAPMTSPMEVVLGGTFPTSMDELADMKQAAEGHPGPVPSAHLGLSFTKEVDVDLYPVLKSHVIKEKPVVPFALMTEWFGHGALHKNPGFLLHGLDGMRVFKGIKIEGKTRTIRLMSGKPARNEGGLYTLDLEIRNGSQNREVVHSKASAVLAERLPEPPAFAIPAEILAGTYSRDIRQAYEQVLFHGPDLHGIQAVKGCTEKGMVAEVASAPPPSAWIADPLRTNWVADPLAIDSAYQMAILWCYEQKGVVSLPSYAASYRQYSREFPHDGMTVVMEVKGLTEHKMTSDFTFLDKKNNVVATITGYEAVMDESLLGSFGKEEPKEKETGVLFDRKKLLAYAVGNPSEAFGEKYKVFDKDRIIARLPGPPYFFMDAVTRADHKAWDLKAGGWIEAEYQVPADEWYFRANRSDNMPFCVLLEIALQPCGWLAAYAGSALRNEKQLKFRNLGGKAVLYKEVTRGYGTLTMRTRMTKVSEAAGMIIEDFDLEILHDGDMIYKGVTNFGFFTNETMEQQVGIRHPETIIYTPSDEELARSKRVDFKAEAPLNPTDTDADPFKPASLPSKAILMVDGVECYIKDGGPSGLGYVKGYKTVDPDEWFFKAHFYQDPVCPGSLGIESFIQLMKFAALDRFGNLADTHRIDFVTGAEHQWLYRGQVIPRNKKVEVTALVTSVTEGETPALFADGYLTVDGILIYQMKNFGIRMTPIAPA